MRYRSIDSPGCIDLECLFVTPANRHTSIRQQASGEIMAGLTPVLIAAPEEARFPGMVGGEKARQQIEDFDVLVLAVLNNA